MIETDYILSIENKECYTSNANGFVVDNMFITAGHVVIDSTEDSLYIKVNNKINILKRSEAKYCEFNGENGIDVAIFEIEGVESPLKVSSHELLFGDRGCIKSYRVFAQGEEYFCTSATILEKVHPEFPLYWAETSEVLEPGSSGSPMIINNEVRGMVIAGPHDGPSQKCVILSAHVIKDIIGRQ